MADDDDVVGQVTLVSVDSHMNEPEELWVERLPRRYRERAPRWLHVDDSQKIFVSNGRIVSHVPEYRRYFHASDGSLAFVSPMEERDDVWFEDIANDDPDGRIKDLDDDGVWAETVHPNLGLFVYDMAGELSMLCAQIYNDYAAERYGPYAHRILVNAVIPVSDPAAAVAEIERAAGMGFKGIELPISAPAGRPWYLAMYEPIWDAAAANGMVVAMHAGTGTSYVQSAGGGFSEMGGMSPGDVLGARDEAAVNAQRGALLRRTAGGGIGGNAGQCAVTIPELVCSGVLDRHPDLHFVMVETGCRWLANVLDNLDMAWDDSVTFRQVNRVWFTAAGNPIPQFFADDLQQEWNYPLLPSEYVKRQIHVGFMEDWRGLRNRDITGIDALVWGSDYPHYEGTWPMSRASMEKQSELAGLTHDEKVAIFGGTLARIYGIELPAAATA